MNAARPGLAALGQHVFKNAHALAASILTETHVHMYVACFSVLDHSLIVAPLTGIGNDACNSMLDQGKANFCGSDSDSDSMRRIIQNINP